MARAASSKAPNFHCTTAREFVATKWHRVVLGACLADVVN